LSVDALRRKEGFMIRKGMKKKTGKGSLTELELELLRQLVQSKQKI